VGIGFAAPGFRKKSSLVVLTIEHMFDTVADMEASLTQLADAASAARALVAGCTEPADMRQALIALQHHLDAITVTQATLIDNATRSRAWEGTGARNMADWLAGKTNTTRSSANRKARLGAAMGKSKKLADAVDNGELSPDAAGELANLFDNPPDNATDDDLDELIDTVKGASPRDTRDAAEKFRDILNNETDEEAADRRYRQRSVTSTVPIDGMVTTSITLPTLEARMFLNAITHAAGPFTQGDTRSHAQRLADGTIALADAYAKGAVTGGREKPTVVITMSLDTYLGLDDHDAHTAHGDRIPAHIARRLAAHADLQRVITAGNAILHMGRKVRCATDDHYRALVARDGGCRWPGCHAPAAWCDIDHITPWHQGGTTDPDNLIMWCRHHHTERHRPGVVVNGTANHLTVTHPDGTTTHCPLPSGTREPRRPATAAA